MADSALTRPAQTGMKRHDARAIIAGRLTGNQRRRLAFRAKGLGRKLLAEFATIVSPKMLLAWHRKLISEKHDGSGKRGPGRPRTADEIEALVIRMAEENRDWAIGASKAPCSI